MAQHTITLQDGRILAYAFYGDPNGRPVFFFHGGNDTSLAGKLLQQGAMQAGLQIIAPDRPGYGESSPHPERRYLDWAKDIRQLADTLNITTFAVIGHSGGGPHALATAHALPDRVSHVATIASGAPPDAPDNRPISPFKFIFFLAKVFPGLHRRLMLSQQNQLANGTRFLSQWGRMSKPDGLVFEESAVADIVIDEMRYAYHQGVDGILTEHHLYITPWDFELAEINVPVHVWHGTKDVMSALSWADAIADRVPNSTRHIIEGEGHFSLLINHQDAILASISAA